MSVFASEPTAKPVPRQRVWGMGSRLYSLMSIVVGEGRAAGACGRLNRILSFLELTLCLLYFSVLCLFVSKLNGLIAHTCLCMQMTCGPG